MCTELNNEDIEEVDVAAKLPVIFELDDMRAEVEEAFAQVDEGLEMLRGETAEHEGRVTVAREQTKPILLVDVIVGLGLAPSKKEAQRLIDGGAVKLNDVAVTDKFALYEHAPGTILRVGKRKVVKLV